MPVHIPGNNYAILLHLDTRYARRILQSLADIFLRKRITNFEYQSCNIAGDYARYLTR